MTTYEWLGLIVVLIGGFWKLCDKLTRIEVRLSGKVEYDDCTERQDKCPCHEQIKKMETRIEKLHPPK